MPDLQDQVNCFAPSTKQRHWESGTRENQLASAHFENLDPNFPESRVMKNKSLLFKSHRDRVLSPDMLKRIVSLFSISTLVFTDSDDWVFISYVFLKNKKR